MEGAVKDNLSAIICWTLLASCVFKSSGVAASIYDSHSSAVPEASSHEPAIAISSIFSTADSPSRPIDVVLKSVP